MRTIKVGIIGTGFIGPAHVEALRRLGSVEVVGLAESNPGLAKEKAKLLGIPRFYGDYKDLLKDGSIEAVHNCTPNFVHFKINKDVIAAGKHLVSEKPLAMNSKESGELVRLAKKARILNGINFNYRFYPLIQHARAIITDKKAGDVRLVHGSYLQDWLLFDTDYNWRLEPAVGGKSRAVADIGSHWCDLIQHVTGLRIVEVMADLSTVIPVRKKPKTAIETFAGKELKPSDYDHIKIATEDYASVLLRFDNGARGVFTVSQVSPGRKNRLYFEIDGSDHSIVWDQEKPEEMWMGYRDRPNELLMKDPSLLHAQAKPYAHYPGGHPEGYPDGPKNFFRNFYQWIAEGKVPSKGQADFATFEDGHCEILICEAILKSSKLKKWVKV
ncbi:MAG: Gfo/Idh/MocA family oxidoreductase [Acidobacteria bacterium]|nr:Gfo/Idh/MocA family oxidoreductase [Acidobacteriota bacterium]MCI0720666.1 Gfo/Idh/MocA family oxidoreductase [Acidobacteriota bacterium]